MTVMLNGDTTKKANIILDFLYKTFGSTGISWPVPWLPCKWTYLATKHLRSLQLLPLGFHEGKIIAKRVSLFDWKQGHGSPTLLRDYSRYVLSYAHEQKEIIFWKFYSRRAAILYMYSTKDKSPCLGACVHIETWTIMWWLQFCEKFK